MIVYKGDEVNFNVLQYRNGDGLAVQMNYHDIEDGWMPYGVATVNLGLGDFCGPRSAFIDGNNMPDVGKWLEDNGFAFGTGVEVPSGYCMYEMYTFSDRFFESAGVEAPGHSIDFIMGIGEDRKTADDYVCDLSCDLLAKNGEVMPAVIKGLPEEAILISDARNNRTAVVLDDNEEYEISWDATDRYEAGSVVRTGAQLKPLVFGAMDKKMEASLVRESEIDYSVPGLDSIYSDDYSYGNEYD